jgi:hypothetical protein
MGLLGRKNETGSNGGWYCDGCSTWHDGACPRSRRLK